MERRHWTPDELEALRRMAAEGMPARDIAAALNRSVNALYSLRQKTPDIVFLGRAISQRRACPDDLAEVFETKSLKDLMLHYHCSYKVLREWMTEKGLVSRRPSFTLTKPVRPKPPRPQRPKLRFVPPRAQRSPVDRFVRDSSAAGMAADYLRPDYVPVYRCTADGQPKPEGSHWRCGRLVLTDAEIIERADSLRARRARKLAA